MAKLSRPTIYEPGRCPVCDHPIDGWETGYPFASSDLASSISLLSAIREIRLRPCGHYVESITFEAKAHYDLATVRAIGA